MSDLPLAVAAVIVHERRLLMIRRGAVPFSGHWAPITGKVEPGESLVEATVREAQEEMGLRVAAVGPAFHVCPTSDGLYELHFLRARWLGGTPTPDAREVADWGWFTLAEVEELRPRFEADLVALRELRL